MSTPWEFLRCATFEVFWSFADLTCRQLNRQKLNSFQMNAATEWEAMNRFYKKNLEKKTFWTEIFLGKKTLYKQIPSFFKFWLINRSRYNPLKYYDDKSTTRLSGKYIFNLERNFKLFEVVLGWRSCQTL